MTEKTRILLLESIHPVARDFLLNQGYEVDLRDRSLSEDELIDALDGVNIIGIRSKTNMTEKVLKAAKDLWAIGAFCIGTNQVHLKSATQCGVPVFNAPFSNTRSVAELVIAEIVMLSRQIGDRSKQMHEGKWRKIAKGAREVRGKVLGVVGYGHIGRQVGVMAEFMGMQVQFYDVQTVLPMGNNRPVNSLEEVLETSDFVTLHVPETPQTKKMIGKAELARMKEGACLLNLSRGTVVDIPALADALRSGHLSGASVDVFPKEPKANVSDDFTSELCGLENVILTPHIGGSTLEAQESIGREVGATIDKFIRSGGTVGSVNFPQVDLPVNAHAHRVLHLHKNVPGVLSDVNHIVSEANANIVAQLLGTEGDIGYLVMDVDRAVDDVLAAMKDLPTTLKVRQV